VTPLLDILAACANARLFAPWFRDRVTWAAWFVFLAALFGLPMTPEQVEVYRRHTGRTAPPTMAAREAYLCCGRRAGKSFIMALTCVFLAVFRDYRPWLQPGERATVAVIAADRKQARVILRYARAMLTGIPALKRLVERETAEGFDLFGQVTIEVGTASARSTRGYVYAAVLVDEIAHIPSDETSANPDAEVIAAIRPGLMQIPGAMLLCGSSPHARRGVLWEAYETNWGRDGGPLFWKAASREMNPTLDQAAIDAELERDPARAAAEYLAEFRTDVERVLTLEAVRACVAPGVRERAYLPGLSYQAFVDPSAGSSDAMTLCIAHAEGRHAVVDLLREIRPPFSPEAVAAEFCDEIKRYGLRHCTGDRWGGLLQRERFAAYGVEYQVADRTASELFLSLIGTINSGSCSLVDDPRLISQLVGLERRTTRAGVREAISHKPGQHDDIANAVAGAVHLATDMPLVPAAASGSYRWM
jgi:hypothetical protein